MDDDQINRLISAIKPKANGWRDFVIYVFLGLTGAMAFVGWTSVDARLTALASQDARITDLVSTLTTTVVGLQKDIEGVKLEQERRRERVYSIQPPPGSRR